MIVQVSTRHPCRSFPASSSRPPMRTLNPRWSHLMMESLIAHTHTPNGVTTQDPTAQSAIFRCTRTQPRIGCTYTSTRCDTRQALAPFRRIHRGGRRWIGACPSGFGSPMLRIAAHRFSRIARMMTIPSLTSDKIRRRPFP
jgi:hypothetical protein